MLKTPADAATTERVRLPGNQKGFIGPIGDDLPSLIPLLFGLVIFFSTFAFTFSVFDSHNTAFSRDLKTLEIARILTSNSYISGIENFSSLCGSLNIVGIKFRAGLTNAETAPEEYKKQYGAYGGINPFNINFFKDSDGSVFECSNTAEKLTAKGAVGREVIVKIFPVALEDNNVVKPMHLVVVAWV